MKFVDKPFCQTCGHPLNPSASLPEKVFSCDSCPDNVKFRKAKAIAYYDSAVGTAVRLLKDQGKTIMADPLADLMIKEMPKLLDIQDYDYIVPVPIHKKKRRKRGYNQMELIGRKLSAEIGIPMEVQSLVKGIDTKPQRGLKVWERQQNIQDSFEVSDRLTVESKRILLIDDVMTTGATVNECAKVLLRDGKARYTDVLVLTRAVYSNDFYDM